MRRAGGRDYSKGFLDFPGGRQFFRLQRLAPDVGLQHWIDSYWIVAWDVPHGHYHRQTNIAHASIKAVIEPDGAFLYGVPGRTVTRRLSGSGETFGVIFRPGGFYPFWGSPLKDLSGKRLALGRPFGAAAVSWTGDMALARDADDRRSITDAFWRKLRDTARSDAFSDGPTVATIVAERIISDRSIVTVSAAASAVGMDVRGLQRLFHREVGIPPKEVIRRYRLQEAAERLLKNPEARSDEIAIELGYFDQSHFINDFRSVVGVSPDSYRRRQQAR